MRTLPNPTSVVVPAAAPRRLLSRLALSLFVGLLAGPVLSTPASARTPTTIAEPAKTAPSLVALTVEQQQALRKAMGDPKRAALVQAELVRQVRVTPPVGIVSGLWVVVLDPRGIASAAGVPLPDGGLRPQGNLLPGDSGLAVLIPNGRYQELNPQGVRDINGALGRIDALTNVGTAAQQAATDDFLWFIAAAVIFVVDNSTAVAASAVAGAAIYAYLDDTGANDDYDDDGIINERDPDDDNDGVPDTDDKEPFDDDASICDLCGRGAGAVEVSVLVDGQVGAIQAGILSIAGTLGSASHLQVPASGTLPALNMPF